MSEKRGVQSSYDRPIFGDAKEAKSVPRRSKRVSLQARMFIFSVIALVAIVAVVTLFLRPKEKRYVLDNYQVAEVGRSDFRGLVISAGRVMPDEVVAWSCPTMKARVQQVYVQPGDDVAVGQVLMELVSESLMEDLTKAEGDWAEATIELAQARLQAEQETITKERELSQARAALVEAEEQFALLQKLYVRGGVSKRDLDQAAEDVEQRKLQIEMAERALAFTEQKGELAISKAEQKAYTAHRQVEALNEQVKALTVRTNVAGRILSVPVRMGETVSEGTQLISVADLSKQYVETAITPEQALEVRSGMSAVLRFGGQAVPATVGFVSPQATATSEGAAVAVRLDVRPAAARTLVPNSDVSVEIELGMREGVIAVGRGPFFASGDASFVYVISEDGRQAHRRDVRFGAVDGSTVEVLTGLEAGERIIYSSYSAFRAYPTVELLPEGGRDVEWRHE